MAVKDKVGTANRAALAAQTTRNDASIIQRKTEHVEICASENVEAKASNGLEQTKLPVCSLPSVALPDIELTTSLFGRAFKLPIYIPGMTGGMSEGARINRNLAAAATKFGIPMGVGSQRVMLDVPDPKLQKNINQTFALKDEFPNLFLIGNLGMGQLSGPGGVDAAIKCAEMIDADAMAIHCNSLQEIVQEDGDRDFSQVIENLAKLKQEISIPLLVKEVGTGMDLSSMENLASIGLGASDAIDIGGHGGTSWPWIEALRGNERSKRIGGLLRELGVSTAQSIRNFHHSFSKIHSEHPAPRLIATGGIRSGLDIAKAVFLGASSCGVGLPLFRAALVGPEKVAEELSLLEEELRAVMLACDAKSLPALHAKNKANAKHAQRNVT